jgi:hypothetical protein
MGKWLALVRKHASCLVLRRFGTVRAICGIRRQLRVELVASGGFEPPFQP